MSLPSSITSSAPPPPSGPSSHNGIAAHLTAQFSGCWAGPSQPILRRCIEDGIEGAMPRTRITDMLVEPVALQLGVAHLLGAGDDATAPRSVAEALEGLGHVPLGRWVEELRVFGE